MEGRNVLKDLIKYAPKEVLARLILNVDRQDIMSVCSLNKKMHEICMSPLVQVLYLKKNPRWFYRSIHSVDIKDVNPHVIDKKTKKGDFYTDGHDSWAFSGKSVFCYVSAPYGNYRLKILLVNLTEDYWMKILYIIDTKTDEEIEFEYWVPGLDVIFFNLVKYMDKAYIMNGLGTDEETQESQDATIRFIEEMEKYGVKFISIEDMYRKYHYGEVASDDDSF